MNYRAGNIVHVEIPAPDIARLREFYGVVFGWTFTPLHAGYVFFDAGNVAGALVGTAAPSADGTVITIKADDIAAKLAQAAAAGATLLLPPTDVPGGRGRYGYFADPCGNKIGLWMDA